MKVLSICIPSYNMEQYLPRCVDSLIVPSLSKLEIIIVNDGSTDATLEVAESYKKRYPDSVVVLDKKNGHYGSTINSALEIATGKYFRILDADDWFDSEVLETFVSKLESLDVDCVYTRFSEHDLNKGTIVEKGVKGLKADTLLKLDEYLLPDSMYAMHSLTYRLSYLRDIGYRQTEGICFTDVEYVLYPLSAAKTLYSIDCSLYQYLLGREGQSVSFPSMLKTLSHRLKIVTRILDEWDLSERNQNYQMLRRAVTSLLMCRFFRAYLLHSKYDESLDITAYDLMNKIKEKDGSTFSNIMNAKSLVFIHHIKFWYNKRKCAMKYLKYVGYALRMLGMR